MITSNIKEQLALTILNTFPHLEELKDLLTNGDTKLAADLQLDSFSIISLQVSIEDNFGLFFDPIEDDFVEIFCTIESLTNYISSKIEV